MLGMKHLEPGQREVMVQLGGQDSNLPVSRPSPALRCLALFSAGCDLENGLVPVAPSWC